MARQQQEDLQTTTLLKHIFSGLRKHGAGNFIRILQAAETSSHNIYLTELTNAIISQVAKSSRISVASVYNGYYKTDARDLCYVLMKKFIGMTEYEIACFFNRDNSVVYKAVRRFSTLNMNIKSHKKMRECYDGLCKKMDVIQKELKEKHDVKC